MRVLTAMIIALAMLMTATATMALTATNTLDVRAIVIGTCRVMSASDVDFGNYDPTDPADDTDGVGSATFRCTKNTSYGTYIVRTNGMSGGPDTLNYELYTDVARTTTFPSGSVGTPKIAPSNAPITEDIYGTITALQNVASGNYIETVTFTVEY